MVILLWYHVHLAAMTHQIQYWYAPGTTAAARNAYELEPNGAALLSPLARHITTGS